MIKGTLERLMNTNNHPSGGGIFKLLENEFLEVGVDPTRYENFLTSGDPNVRVTECEEVDSMLLPLGTHD